MIKAIRFRARSSIQLCHDNDAEQFRFCSPQNSVTKYLQTCSDFYLNENLSKFLFEFSRYARIMVTTVLNMLTHISIYASHIVLMSKHHLYASFVCASIKCLVLQWIVTIVIQNIILKYSRIGMIEEIACLSLIHCTCELYI